MSFPCETENTGREADLLVYMLSSVSLRVTYIYMISKEKYSVGSWRYDYRDGVGENLDSVGNKEINLNVEEEEQRAYGISWKE